MVIHPAVFKASSIPVATSCFALETKVVLTFVPPVYVVAVNPRIVLALFEGAFTKIVDVAPLVDVVLMRTKLAPLIVTTEAVALVSAERSATTCAAVRAAP
jgi:hypothetical protein